MTEEIEPHIVQRYQIVKKIGSGAYGHVWKVIDRQTKVVKALKKNFDAFSNSTDAQRTYREIMFLRQLKHPNIIGLEKVIPARNDKDIYLVFQHMDIDLHTLIRQDGRSTQLQERHKQFIVHQIAKSIYYLHHSNLIHRDLKPSNVLINENCEAKLCDFGLVRLMEEPANQELVIMTDYIATRWYRAPELLLGSKDYSKEVDIWALGCLIGEMFMGKAMFPGTSTINQIEKVVAWTGTPSAQDLKHLSSSLNQSVMQLLNVRKKIVKSQLFGGKLNPQCLDLITRMLQFNPSKRLTIQEVLKHQYLSEFYDEKEMKQMRSSRTKIHLHISDNTKLSLKDYRQLIYSQVTNKKKALTNINFSTSNTSHTSYASQQHSKSKTKHQQNKKKQMSKEKCRTRTMTHDHPQNCKYITFESTTSQQQIRPMRKQVKSFMEKSVKSRPQSRKKGISLCSKSMSKPVSLSKKKPEHESSDNYQNSKSEIFKKGKTNSRSCTQKYDKTKRSTTAQQNINRSRKRVLLSECYVNDNIGKRFYHQQVKGN